MQGKNVVETSPRPRRSRFESLSLSEGRWFTTKSDGMCFLPVQVEADNVFEQFEPLQHRGAYRRPEQVHRLRLGVWFTGCNMRSQAGSSERQDYPSNSSNSALASCRSAVSKPSVNQP